jgi:hypothetical protein
VRRSAWLILSVSSGLLFTRDPVLVAALLLAQVIFKLITTVTDG